ncbi:SdrH family protein [Staphylococcus ratti]|uniref:SdrH family protein n=1 Tax=Staphylococcus ratti TaxID=2892440 RepID=A0ABY3PEK2_9STAP|nr:SdrH family protein [Staphylococcus ratti]UEX90751.1 SdrH family protein [Staphylococcus ratti]
MFKKKNTRRLKMVSVALLTIGTLFYVPTSVVTSANATTDKLTASIIGLTDTHTLAYTNVSHLSNSTRALFEALSTEESSTEEPSTEQPSTEEPSTEQPSTEEPSTEQPSTEEPSTEQPSTEEPSTEQPSTEEPSTEQPSTEEPSTEQPSTEEPSTEQPSTEEPSTEQPIPPNQGNGTNTDNRQGPIVIDPTHRNTGGLNPGTDFILNPGLRHQQAKNDEMLLNQSFNPLATRQYYQNLDRKMLALMTGEIGSITDNKKASGRLNASSQNEDKVHEINQNGENLEASQNGNHHNGKHEGLNILKYIGIGIGSLLFIVGFSYAIWRRIKKFN